MEKTSDANAQDFADRSVALQRMVLGVLEANLVPETPMRRLVAAHAVGELLGRILVGEVQANPAGLSTVIQICDSLRDQVNLAAAATGGTTRH